MSNNQWKSLATPQDNSLYKKLDEIQTASDSLFTVITTALSVAQSVLIFVQSLLGLFESPIVILLNEIIKTLEGLRDDLLKAGVYFTWDRDIKFIFSEPSRLAGGYPAFEERMVAKLSNEFDPTRPDFSSRTDILALTFHVGVKDTARIKSLVKLIQKMVSGADKKADMTLPAPILSSVTYYKSFGINVEMPASEITQDNRPEGLRVKWGVSVPKDRNPFFPSFVSPPTRFIVVVSTRKYPLKLKVSVETASDTSTSSTARRTDFDVIGSHADTRLVHLTDFDGFTVTAKTRGLPYARYPGRDPSETGVTYAKAREEVKMFVYEPSDTGTFLEGSDYELDIPFTELEQLKLYEQDNPSSRVDKYYVTLFSCSEENTSNLVGISKVREEFKSLPKRGALSKPSGQKVVTKIDNQQSLYLSALREALSAFILCRLDRETDRYANFDTPNPMTISKRQTVLDLIGVSTEELDALRKVSARSYKDKVQKMVAKAVERFELRSLPSSSILLGVEEAVDSLNGMLTAKPYEIITSPYSYFNLVSNTQDQESLFELYALYGEVKLITSSAPTIATSDRIIRDESLSDNYSTIEKYKTYADLVLSPREYFNEHLDNVARALGVIPNSLPVASGEWDRFLFFDKFDIPISKFMDLLINFFQDLRKSVSSIVDVVERYIALLSKRIDEIQRMVNEIKKLIDLILSFRFPAGMDVLLTLSQGTSGVISDLVSSDKKPQSEFVSGEGSDGHSAGAMLVFSAGTPAIVRELIEKLVGGKLEDIGGEE